MPRSGRDPHAFFKDLVDKAIILAERERNERDRRTNEARMEALIEIAKMSDREFSEVVSYSLEKSIVLTGSDIGYVALFERDANRLRMLAWSSKALEDCSVNHNSVLFDMRNTGLWGEPIRTGRSYIINDYANDHKQMKRGTPAGHVAIDRILMVPIYVDGELIGTAGVGNKASDYTQFDELQLNLLMVELFTIYNKIQEVKRYRGYSGIVKAFSETGPVGFMFLDTEMKILTVNRLAEQILGSAGEGGRLTLDSMRSDNADMVRSLVNMCRLSKGTHRVHMSPPDSQQIFECSVGYSNDIEVPGLTVWFTDVTYSSLMDAGRIRATEHMKVLEGPVLESLTMSRDLLVPLGDITDDAYPGILALDEAVSFMRDYRRVGTGQASWIPLSDAIRDAAAGEVPRSLSVTQSTHGFEVLAGPELPVAFRGMMAFSASRGRMASNASIACRITSGDLTIVYRDDGPPMSESECFTAFDTVGTGGLRLLLAAAVAESNRFSIECIPSPDGACIEVTVPSDLYRMV